MDATMIERSGIAPTTAGTTVALASSQADAAAVEAVERHHAELAGALTGHVEALLVAATSGTGEAVDLARDRLVSFCTIELLPHAAAEESTLYPAAAADARARLLVEAMMGEHRVLKQLVSDIATPGVAPVRTAAAGRALQVLFDTHLVKENELVLPLVAADPDLSLSTILAGMHELLGGDGHDAAVHEHGAEAGTSCGCAAEEAGSAVVLDVREIPHAIRHATVFGAMGAVPPGEALVLVAPHDPLPLLAQLEQREPNTFTVAYEERGPEAWRLRISRSR